MSVHITSAVWRDSKADGSGLLVLLALADQAQDDGRAWPSVANIASRCRRSERAVQDQLAALVKAGELQREERSGRSTVYRVMFGWEGAEQARKAPSQRGAVSAPPQNLHPAESAPGGAVHRTGGVRSTAPRNVKETSPTRQGAQQRAHRLPAGWTPSPDLVAQMRSEQPAIDQDLELRKFRDHWAAQGGQRGAKLDWPATYRNWIRNSSPPRGQTGAQPGYRQTPEQLRQDRLARAGDLTPPARLGGDPAAERAWLREARRRIADGLPLDDIGDAA